MDEIVYIFFVSRFGFVLITPIALIDQTSSNSLATEYQFARLISSFT